MPHTQRCLRACRYRGKGVTKAVQNINTIIGPALVVSTHRTRAPLLNDAPLPSAAAE